MTSPQEFFSPDEIKAITDAVVAAEKNTSGEICVHVDQSCSGDPLEQAKQVFKARALHKTKFRNAVLFYVALDDKKFAIWGDKGINDKVADDFWDNEAALLLQHFKQGQYATGLIEVINLAGEKLQEYFPYEQKGSLNEIENEISFGRD